MYTQAPSHSPVAPSRRTALAYVLGLAAACRSAGAQDAEKPDWQDVLHTAERYVAHESPAESWPFERADREALLKSPRKVFFHYFPPFPLSFRNLGRGNDHYDDQYLRRDGESSKFAKVGGYLRERPLAAGPWQTPHWQQINFAIELLRARSTGADGFMMDILRLNSDPSWAQTLKLFDTAAAVTPDFHIAPELDAAAMKLKSTQPAETIQSLLELARSPAAYRLQDGRILVSPFSPENLPPAFWKTVVDGMASNKHPIAFLPVFLSPIRSAPAFASFSYGLSYWESNGAVAAQKAYDDSIRRAFTPLSPVFMVPVTPQDSRPKTAAFSESNNTLSFRQHWMYAIENGAQLVQVVTWNDYSEATEIAPSSGTQFVFFDLATYFIAWFKLGRPPKIIRDAIYYLHRRQLVTPGAPHIPGDTPLHLSGLAPIQNQIELLAMLTKPATLQIEIAGRRFESSVNSGMASLLAPPSPGRPVFRIVRNGRVELEKQSDWEISGHPDRDDVLYVGGSTTRKFCANAQC